MRTLHKADSSQRALLTEHCCTEKSLHIKICKYSFEEGLVQAVSKGSVIVAFHKVSMGLEVKARVFVCLFAFVMFKATGTK